jgi:hypothetical protein
MMIRSKLNLLSFRIPSAAKSLYHRLRWLKVLFLYIVASSLAHAVPIAYNNRGAFEAQLSTAITDDYSNAGYASGDVLDGATIDIHSNAQMSAILGETMYTSTSPFNQPIGWNMIVTQNSDPRYCTGCNGSFLLDFSSTAVSDPSGVFGAGFDFFSSSNLIYAFVTLGNSATYNFQLSGSGFFGVTATETISSIHVGLFNGGTTGSESVSIDNLTIGGAVPEPTTLALIGMGIAGIGYGRRKKA